MSKFFEKDDAYWVELPNKDQPIQLSDFRVKITQEVQEIDLSGNTSVVIVFDVVKDKTVIGSFRLPAFEFFEFKWVTRILGLRASIFTRNLPRAKVLGYLEEAIKTTNREYTTKTAYRRLGYVSDPNGNVKFLFANGSVSKDGIAYTEETQVHQKLQAYQIPANSKAKLVDDIRAVLKLLKLSETNRYIGLIPCLAPLRASATLLLPMDTWFFLVGRTQTFKTTVAALCTTFFGAMDNAANLVSWNSTEYAMTDLMLMAQNTVLGVDDFVYHPGSGKAKDFTDRAETFLRACANGNFRSRRDQSGAGIEDKGRLNSMLIATGEFAPSGVPDSMHARGIYIPFNRGDIQPQTLSRFQDLGKDGVFVRVNGMRLAPPSEHPFRNPAC